MPRVLRWATPPLSLGQPPSGRRRTAPARATIPRTIGPRRRELLPDCVLCVAVFAYLDPGTGSMLVQLLVGGMAAVAVTAKFYWRRVLTILRIRKPEPEPDKET